MDCVAGQAVNPAADLLGRLTGRDVAVKFLVCQAHLPLIGLAAPQAGRWGLADYSFGYAEVFRQLTDLALEQISQRQDIDSGVAVLGAVPDRDLAPVACADNKIMEAVGEVVEGGHPQPWLKVSLGQLSGTRIVSTIRKGTQQGVINAVQLHCDGGDGKLPGNQQGIFHIRF